MFDQIIENEQAKTVLKKVLASNSIPNTMLFQGPDGVGKSLFAKDLAKQLISSSDKRSINKIDNLSHPDFYVYFPVDGMHSIQEMRNMIDEVYKSPYEGKSKVFIIHDAEKMLPSSANSILKTLEEPNLSSYIILLSSKPNMLLTTIQSRCFKVNFNSIDTGKIVSYLENTLNKSNDLSIYIAKMATGSIGRAHLIASNKHFEATIEKLVDILEKRSMPTFEEIDDICEKLDPKDTGLNIISSILLMWFRDQSICHLKCDKKTLFFQANKSESNNAIPLENIHYLLDKINMGFERNIKLSNCLYNFFIEISLV